MDKGAHYFQTDLQVHTPRDTHWNGNDCVTEGERKAYAKTLVAACRERELSAIAITDHHDMAFAQFIRQAASDELDTDGRPVAPEEKLIVFPGMELTLGVPCQALVIFDADFPEGHFSLAMTALAIKPSPANEAKIAPINRLQSVDSLKDLKERLDEHVELRNRYTVFPHVGESGKFSLLRKGFPGKYVEMPWVGGFVDGSVEKLGTGNRSIIAGRAAEWGNKRVAVFQTSDNRSSDHRDLGSWTTWVKWATPTAEALRQACLAQESRISQERPVLPGSFITSVSVSNSAFLGPIELDLNPQYTSLIGGRGTGKSTLLEYIRWGLCDQVSTATDDDELPNYQARRQALVEATLKRLDATVQIGFELNGIPHVVRRNSGTQEILLKIGGDEFAQRTEEEVRSLLPIQAYSQKQLSNVGIRLDELVRFVRSPIRGQLDDVSERIEAITSETREIYATLSRKRSIEQSIANSELTIASLQKQAENLRSSLIDVSEEDSAIIQKQVTYENARSQVAGMSESVIGLDQLVQNFLEDVDALGEGDLSSVGDLTEIEVLQNIQKLIHEALEVAQSKGSEIQQYLRQFVGEDQEFVGLYRTESDNWNEALASFQTNYEEAIARSSSHETQLEELSGIEARIRDLTEKTRQERATISTLGAPDDRYADLRDDWRNQHKRQTELIEAECIRLTKLSNREIRATLKRGTGLELLTKKLLSIVRGSGLRSNKIEQIIADISESENPFHRWDEILHDLELLANFDHEEQEADTVPATPALATSGIKKGDAQKIASKVTPEAWLDLALTPLDDQPTFEFRVREEEYIPFDHASAGQQATALLKTLLRPGQVSQRNGESIRHRRL